MTPEALLNQQTDQAPIVDGRHPFDQGAAAGHWGAVQADIFSRSSLKPIDLPEELRAQAIQDSIDAHPGWLDEFYTQTPRPQTIFDPKAQETAAIVAEQEQNRLIDRARNAWDMLRTTVTFPELKPLTLPALALTVAACGGSEVAPTPFQTENASNPPIVITSPDISQEPVSPSPSVKITPFPGTGNTYPEVTPIPEPTPTPTETPKPTPTPEITPEPALTAMDIANQIINQDRTDIKTTKITHIKAEIDALWDKYGNILSEVKWRYSPTKTVIKDHFLEYISYIAKGSTKNAPAKQIIDERSGYAAGFVGFQLYIYENITDPQAKAELAKSADMVYDYALTSIPEYPGDASRNKDTLIQDIPVKINNFIFLNQ